MTDNDKLLGMKKLLVIEDDLVTQAIIQKSLQNEYVVVSCLNLAEARLALEAQELPILILLDRGLPDGDGLAFCSQLRQQERFQSLPLIFLSGATSESDKVIGLFAGADDYITKPFGVLELKARIQARLRFTQKILSMANVQIDIDSHRAFVLSANKTQEIELTRIEFKILHSFFQASDRVLSRSHLLDKVWGVGCAISDRVVDTHVSHLRKKLLNTYLQIEAIRGEGYRMKSIATQAPAA